MTWSFHFSTEKDYDIWTPVSKEQIVGSIFSQLRAIRSKKAETNANIGVDVNAVNSLNVYFLFYLSFHGIMVSRLVKGLYVCPPAVHCWNPADR